MLPESFIVCINLFYVTELHVQYKVPHALLKGLILTQKEQKLMTQKLLMAAFSGRRIFGKAFTE